MRPALRLVFTLILTLWGLLAPVLSGEERRYVAQLAAGSAGPLSFRTVLRLSNHTAENKQVGMVFHAADGLVLELDLEMIWAGPAGDYSRSEEGIDVLLPPTSRLDVVLVPGAHPVAGWVQMTCSGHCDADAFFQFSNRPDYPPTTVPPGVFEDGLEQESRLLPSSGAREFVFPVSLYRGEQELNTAFALVNLAAREIDVELSVVPDHVHSVKIPAHGSFSGYVTEVWDGPVILDSYPLRIEATARVVSPVPLGVTVFRTRAGIPLSGVPVSMLQEEPEIVPVVLGEEFLLRNGETAEVTGEGLRLNFWNVVEDSRCPTGATCVWEGQASVAIRVEREGKPMQELTLTSRAGQPDRATQGLDGYTVTLLKVEPYPDLSAPPIRIEDYVLTLVVTTD